MKLHKYSAEQLKIAVENSTSMRQVLQKLNVAPYGGNYIAQRFSSGLPSQLCAEVSPNLTPFTSDVSNLSAQFT
jgi:hypothetical protein